REANPEKFRAKNRENARRWQKANPDKHRANQQRRRARKTGARHIPYTEAEKLAFWTRVGIPEGRCFVGWLQGEDCAYETTDHIIPLAAEGIRAWDAVPAYLPMCRAHNSAKNARLFSPDGDLTPEERRFVQRWAEATDGYLRSKGLLG